jgi:hypothetical protein
VHHADGFDLLASGKGIARESSTTHQKWTTRPAEMRVQLVWLPGVLRPT